ncbi:MAG: hypothetical protein IKE46_00490 [Selenomonadaceae bacterium]|nr:hypothetical protein [Selenomonadaceae bacterium]
MHRFRTSSVSGVEVLNLIGVGDKLLEKTATKSKPPEWVIAIILDRVLND